MILFLTGCSEKTLFVKKTKDYPTFNTEEFKRSKKVDLSFTVKDDKIEIDKKELILFIQDVKVLRGDYNLLLRGIRDFNRKLKNR